MITLGYGEIKGDTFPDDVDQGKTSVFTVMYLAAGKSTHAAQCIFHVFAPCIWSVFTLSATLLGTLQALH